MCNLGNYITRTNPDESIELLMRVKHMTKKHEGLMLLPHVSATYRLGANLIEKYTKERSDKKENIKELDNALGC